MTRYIYKMLEKPKTIDEKENFMKKLSELGFWGYKVVPVQFTNHLLLVKEAEE